MSNRICTHPKKRSRRERAMALIHRRITFWSSQGESFTDDKGQLHDCAAKLAQAHRDLSNTKAYL